MAHPDPGVAIAQLHPHRLAQAYGEVTRWLFERRKTT